MTLEEIRWCYPNYAKKEALLAKIEKWRAIYEYLDSQAESVKTKQAGTSCRSEAGSDPKPSKGDGDGG